MTLTRQRLLASATALCNDFAAKSPPDTILSHFSTTHAISATEHGLPLLAPFLGRTFTGRTAGPTSVEAYFALLQKYLTYENMSFGELPPFFSVVVRQARDRALSSGIFFSLSVSLSLVRLRRWPLTNLVSSRMGSRPGRSQSQLQRQSTLQVGGRRRRRPMVGRTVRLRARLRSRSQGDGLSSLG